MFSIGTIGRKILPVAAGILTAAAILAAAWFIGDSEYRRQAQNERLHALQQMSTVRARLEGTLTEKLLLLKSIVSYISLHGNIDHPTFQSFAEGLIAGDRVIRNVTLLKDTVIVDVFPKQGQEKAIGVDLALIPGQRDTLFKAIETREPVIAGPVELVQGGMAIVSRIPIFLTPEGKPLGQGKYWGQTSVVIMQEHLFEQAGLADPSSNLRYAIRGKDGLGSQGAVFWGDESMFQNGPVVMDVSLPGGSWQMAAIPAAGWGAASASVNGIYFVGLLVSLFAGWMTCSLLMAKDRLQQQLVVQRSLMESAKQSEAKYRTLFESANDALFIVKGEAITDCNTAALKILGCEREKIIGKTPHDFSSALQRGGRASKEYAAEIMASAREGKPQFFEWRHCRYDGTPFDAEVSLTSVEIDGEVMIQAAIRDITERKALEEDHVRLAAAIDQTAESILITDPAGLIVYVNPAFALTTGYSREEIIGSNPRLLKSGEHSSSFYDDLWATITAGKIWRGRLTNRRKDGTLLHEDAAISPVRDTAGRIVNFVAVKRDVTKEILLQKQLSEAQKMEAVGTLAGGIAHDFNNLLQVITGFSEVALFDIQEGQPGYSELHEIKNAARSAAELTQGLLTFSRRVESKLRPVDLNKELKRVTTMLRRTIPKMITIEKDLCPDLREVNADPAQLQQVVMNLALNARDAMPNGGTLSIRTANAELDEEYCTTHLLPLPGNYVLLTVSDSGTGMDDETGKHIFDPFFTTKETGKGTGLGLAIAFGIVKSHGGNILCHSRLGSGTTFEIVLPAARSTIDVSETESAATITGGKETILLIDDEDSLRKLARQVLEGVGYTVLTAANGKEGIEVFAREMREIDLVILDLMMPGMGGRSCLRAILDLAPGTKVVIATGYAADGELDRALSEGAAKFVMKPYESQQLLESIRKVLDEG